MPERVHAEHLELKRVAYRFFREALRWGVISAPAACEACGEERELVGHHDDYNASARVTWLCRVCHARWHWGTLSQ